MALTDKLTAIGNAIRVQSGKTELIPLAQMPDEIINLQSLNFDVVGNPQPTNPKENTIWLNTDVEITSWVFSAEEPENLETGNVWIPIGVSGAVSLNALKKNGILLHPLEARQYIDGVLVKKPAAIYQDGDWVEWLMYLFNNGDVKNITGGWKAVHAKLSNTYGDGTPVCTVNDDSIVCHNTNGSSGYLRHNNVIDLTPYTTVHYFGNLTHNSGEQNHAYCKPVIMRDGEANLSNSLASGSISAYGDFEDLQVDVTNVNEPAVVGWMFYSYGGAATRNTLTLRMVWIT